MGKRIMLSLACCKIFLALCLPFEFRDHFKHAISVLFPSSVCFQRCLLTKDVLAGS